MHQAEIQSTNAPLFIRISLSLSLSPPPFLIHTHFLSLALFLPLTTRHEGFHGFVIRRLCSTEDSGVSVLCTECEP